MSIFKLFNPLQPARIITTTFGGSDQFLFYFFRQLRGTAQYPKIFIGTAADKGIVVVLLIQFQHIIVRIEIQKKETFSLPGCAGSGILACPVAVRQIS